MNLPSAPADNGPSPFPVTAHIGTMGWGYSDWAGVMYPAGIPSREQIAVYSRVFNAVEIDSTFYGTPREAQVTQWARATPENFVFCPKVPRLLTHDMRLVGIETPLAEFVRVLGLLGPKRGPILLQMPPDFTQQELPALEAFLPTLPTLDDGTARFAIEFRNRSLLSPDVFGLLTAYNVALAITDYAPMPRRFTLTTDFVYMRIIGRHGAYDRHNESQADRTPELQRWTDALRTHADSFSALYAFTNNDYEGYAPLTANRFKQLLGLPTIESPPEIQGTLF